MVCEMLGCPPSELETKYPNMTVADVVFMMKYGYEKMKREAEMAAKLISPGTGGGAWRQG